MSEGTSEGAGEGTDEPRDPAQGARPPRSDDHDDTGLDLARSIARSLAAGSRRVQRKTARRGTKPVDPTYSGAHPDDRDPQTLDSTLGRLVAEQGWSTDVRMHGVFSRWDAIVGSDVAAHCRPESFAVGEDGAGGKLVVRTDSTAWATQMRMLAPTVIRRLNEVLGDGTVALVDVLGPHSPSWKRGPRSVRDGRGPRDTYG